MYEECNVCIEQRKEDDFVDCPQCPYRACRSCIRTYLLESHLDAHCMNCRHAWPRSVLTRYFPRSFIIGEWKTHRADVLLEREKSLFLDTLPLIEEDRRKARVRQELAKLQEKMAWLESEVAKKKRELEGGTGESSRREKNEYVRPCVYPDCKGFLHEKTGECGLCHQLVCLRCNVVSVKEEEHECREEDVANWNHIRENTKPCPGCHVRIHRISGCHQMWCPQCHCAFDYATGRIETGIVHNPHYFQYIQQHGAAAVAGGGGECMERRPGLPLLYQFQRIVGQQAQRRHWFDFYRGLVHTRQVELPKLREVSTTPLHTLTVELRKQYMCNHITEAYYKKRVQEREKKWWKEKELYAVWDVFLVLGTELVRSLHPEDDEEGWSAKEAQRDQLRNLCNDRIREINFEFQSALPVWNEDYMLIQE